MNYLSILQRDYLPARKDEAAMRNNGFYVRLEDGQYVCPVCGGIYSGCQGAFSCHLKTKVDQAKPGDYVKVEPGGRFVCPVCSKEYHSLYRAVRCCFKGKPYSGSALYQAKQILSKSLPKVPHPRHRPPKESPDQGITYPGRYGHYSRAKKDELFLQYHRAWEFILAAQRQEVTKKLDKVYGSGDGEPVYRVRSTTHLQRLAYAFHNGSWERVRKAAFDLAEVVAQDAKLDLGSFVLTLNDAALLEASQLINEKIKARGLVCYD